MGRFGYTWFYWYRAEVGLGFGIIQAAQILASIPPIFVYIMPFLPRLDLIGEIFVTFMMSVGSLEARLENFLLAGQFPGHSHRVHWAFPV